MNELQSKYSAEIQQILGKYPPDRRASAVMPLLYLAQRQAGYIDRHSVQDIAEIIGLSTTDIDALIGYYTLYHDQPAGRYRLQVCTDLSCALRGAEDFLHNLCANLGIKIGETTSDGLFTIEEVACLAGCHRAPLFQLQGDGEIAYHEDQTVDTALALVNELRRRAAEKEAGNG